MTEMKETPDRECVQSSEGCFKEGPGLCGEGAAGMGEAHQWLLRAAGSAVSALDPSMASQATLTLDSTRGKYCKYSWNFLNTLSLPR